MVVICLPAFCGSVVNVVLAASASFSFLFSGQ